MSSASTNIPRVTIVMTARERHSLTEAAIESIVADTPRPFRFVYVDAQSPEWLRESLAANAGDWGLEVVRFDEPFWPHEARRRIAPMIDTEYAVFLDNDVQVEEGWLDALVACADETGAGIVGPLYLWGDGIAPPKVHMAGGKLVESEEAGRRVLDESHYLFNADPRQVKHELVRRPCDFVEFHCMLIRSELLRDPALFDPAIRCVHEHIDVALQARAQGHSIWFEPAARIHYMAYADHMLDDLGFFRQRWSVAEGESSIARFARKWNVIDDARSFGGVRNFIASHLELIDPLRCDAPDPAERMRSMAASELAQSRSGLLDLAIARGYSTSEIAEIAQAFVVAQRLFDGIYRPCGRPFLDHVVGTASVLVRYDFLPRVVSAGLLHAAYSHAKPHPGGPEATLRAVAEALGGDGGALERRVRAYTDRDAPAAALAGIGEELDAAAPAAADPLSALSIFDAEILAIEAANEIDMHLSGEFRYSGRADELAADKLPRIEAVCRALGVGGMYETLMRARATTTPAPEALQTQILASYRLAHK
jgi:GT2 family glycosyltransferase